MAKSGSTSSSSCSDVSQRSDINEWQRHNRCRKSSFCKVVDCSVDLSALGKPYCLKRRVCPEHLKSAAVQCKGSGDQLWRFCQQCGKMELLKRFAGANRSCKRGLARRRARYTHQHEQAQQQQQQQRDMVDAWQVHSDWAPAEQVPPYQKEEVSDHSQGYRQPASLAAADMVGAVGFSYEPPSCGEGSGSLEGLIDAQLEAMIEDELLAAAAAAIPGDAAGLAMRNTGMLLQMPVEVASVRAPPAAAAAAAARVGASMHHDAQNFRLHSLMGQLAELSATLQQLQQAVGLPQCADSGSDKTGYTY